MKIAVLDLGTNTFHLLIVKVYRNGTYKKIFKSKIAVKLGEGAIQKNMIAAVPFQRGVEALKHYSEILSAHRPDKIIPYATSAIRSARNGKKFIAAVRKETGLNIQIITGDREAELICHGVRQTMSMGDAKHLIMDIGGGSTEFIIANGKEIFWKKSFDIGASRLLETFRPSDPVKSSEIKILEKYFSKILAPLQKALKKYPVKSLIGSSGSFDTFAEMIGWKYHHKDVLKNEETYQFDMKEFLSLSAMLLKSTTAERMKMKGLIKMRVDMIVLAVICTRFVLRRFKIKKLLMSKYALKEGALWEAINPLALERRN
jgi:exopolyphosphatase/guanosine-5'-triphosphate,3'-diphosphate pyrophosphatase